MPKQLKRLKIKRTLSLDAIAHQLAQDIIGAIYSAIGQKNVTDLYVGDQLSDVVDQSLSRTGFAEEMDRMSSTRIRVKLGIDMSGSMFNRSNRSMVRAATMARVLLKAFDEVQGALPPGVFEFSLWMWSHEAYCITHDGYDKIQIVNARTVPAMDAMLESLAKTIPYWAGGGTQLVPLLSKWTQWDLDRPETGTHTLDIVITDGAIWDLEDAEQIQLFRQSGKYMAMMLTIGDYAYDAPNGFVSYAVRSDELQPVIRDTLDQFVKTLY